MYRSRKQLKKTKLTNQYAMARVTGTLKAMGCKTAQTDSLFIWQLFSYFQEMYHNSKNGLSLSLGNKFHFNSSISNSSMPEQCKFPLCCRCVLVKVVIHQTWRYPLKAIQRPAGFLYVCVGGNVFTKINSKTSCVCVGRGGGVNDFIITFRVPSASQVRNQACRG